LTRLSVVSPVYRAEGCVEELHRRLTAVLQSMGVDYEIVLVDDGSPDRSGQKISEFAASDPKVVAVLLSRNFGQHAAITAGVAEAKGDWIIVMDCDLQDRPEDIPLLFAKAAEGHDVVFARRKKPHESFLKRATSRAWFAILNQLTDFPVDSGTGSFSIISRQVADEFLRICDRHRHYVLVLRWLGFEQAYVDVQQAERFAGRSSYTFQALLRHAVSGIASHSTRLLYLSIYAGFAFVALAVVQFAYVIYLKIFRGVGVAGWASLMAAIWLTGGAILSSLGILGIYVGRVFEQVKQRPIYIVRKRVERAS
jgi:polyisoprenyl-phosphate glycosyltransferase